MRDRLGDFVIRKVRAKKTIGLREAATDVAAETGRSRHDLRQSPYHLFGIRCNKIHRVPIIRRMLKGSKNGSHPTSELPFLIASIDPG